MNKQSPFAREEVMEAYLDSLLKEPDDPNDVTARTAKLLEQASQFMAEDALAEPSPSVVETKVESKASAKVLETKSVPEEHIVARAPKQPAVSEETSESKEQSAASVRKVPLKDTLENRFQALFFEVAGLTLAVPLTTLGGIHQIEKIGPLFGKPDWFMGIMMHRESKLNVVDSAKWVMPEKYDENLAQSLNYRYLIMLGDSSWGLASERLVNTVTLTNADVKWRESTGKRPWLAGMVKEKMCALIDVEELISMLNKGLGSNDQTP